MQGKQREAGAWLPAPDLLSCLARVESRTFLGLWLGVSQPPTPSYSEGIHCYPLGFPQPLNFHCRGQEGGGRSSLSVPVCPPQIKRFVRQVPPTSTSEWQLQAGLEGRRLFWGHSWWCWAYSWLGWGIGPWELLGWAPVSRQV